MTAAVSFAAVMSGGQQRLEIALQVFHRPGARKECVEGLLGAIPVALKSGDGIGVGIGQRQRGAGCKIGEAWEHAGIIKVRDRLAIDAQTVALPTREVLPEAPEETAPEIEVGRVVGMAQDETAGEASGGLGLTGEGDVGGGEEAIDLRHLRSQSAGLIGVLIVNEGLGRRLAGETHLRQCALSAISALHLPPAQCHQG